MFYAQHKDLGYQTILMREDGVQKLFLCSRWGMKLSLIVRSYPPPRYPGLEMTAPLSQRLPLYLQMFLQ